MARADRPRGVMMAPAETAQLRAAIESFLYEEAELLDSWKLDEWAALFTEDAINEVPALDDPTRDPANSVFLVNDDLPRIQSRVRQLTGTASGSENPRLLRRRFNTNVRIVAI